MNHNRSSWFESRACAGAREAVADGTVGRSHHLLGQRVNAEVRYLLKLAAIALGLELLFIGGVYLWVHR